MTVTLPPPFYPNHHARDSRIRPSHFQCATLKAGNGRGDETEVHTHLASSPGPKRGPGTHCLRMRQSVPKILVHRIFP